MYKPDLAINNLQWLNAIKPNQTKPKEILLVIVSKVGNHC